MSASPASPLRLYRGGCHCKAIRWEVTAPSHLVCFDCNCSICQLKRNTHFVVPAAAFTLQSPREALSEYSFGTFTAKHMFCRTCGVVSYYHPRSNPDGVAITLWALDEYSPDGAADQSFTWEIRAFDGRNWEASVEASGIRAFSKV